MRRRRRIVALNCARFLWRNGSVADKSERLPSCAGHAERKCAARRDQKFTIEQVCAWADSCFAETGDWPAVDSGKIPGAGGVTWSIVDDSLRKGRGMMPGGSSLAHFLATQRGFFRCPPLTEELILAWADAHHCRTGEWPNRESGPIPEEPGENWQAVTSALVNGLRGLAGGSSLTQLLVEHRGIRSTGYAPPLTIPQILAWADLYRARHGRWPTDRSGPVTEAPGETWLAIRCALVEGLRGLPGGSSLSRLLAPTIESRRETDRRSISVPDILRWADAYREQHGRWPNKSSGCIDEAPGETWGTTRATSESAVAASPHVRRSPCYSRSIAGIGTD